MLALCILSMDLSGSRQSSKHVCIFVSLSVKAVHLELVSDLTTDAFVAYLRRRGKPTLIWSYHGTNFGGAAREIKELTEYLRNQKTQKAISEFCSVQHIQWKFTPEQAPHFGRIWEAAVRSMKTHFRRVVAEIKLTFEECTTILTQIEACLNSGPLVALPSDNDGIEALTLGHFLIRRPMEALPDPLIAVTSQPLAFMPSTYPSLLAKVVAGVYQQSQTLHQVASCLQEFGCW